jgi:hypothetical protein
MSFPICWLLFPVLFGLLALGCGLLIERASGIAIPGVLLLPVGFALILVVSSFTTMTDATAELTVPALIVLAVAGLALSRPWERKPDRWAVAVGLGAFTAFAAPVAFSGHATFAGYHALDDIAIWLGLSDNALEHGRSLAGLAPSGYESFLNAYLDTGYPLAAFVPFGIGHILTGQDSAWIYQPYLAFLGAMLALGLYALTAQLIAARPIRALIVFAAGQPALLYAFSLWGGVKEIVASGLLVLVAALIAHTLQPGEGLRRLLPLAVASAAVLAAMSIAAAVWLGLLLALALALVIKAGRQVVFRQAGTFAAITAILALPAIITAFKFLGPAGTILSRGTELGLLVKPLSLLHVFGIWPAGDFRLDPQVAELAYALMIVVAVAAIVGLGWTVLHRAWAPLGYIATMFAGSLVLVIVGSPWTDAKALAIASPAFVLAALLGAAWVFEYGRKVEAALVAAAIIAGVVWSNALAYLHVPLAPRHRLVELDKIGDRFSKQGPTFVVEDNPYAVLHFLRDAQPSSTSSFRHPLVLRSTGKRVEFAAFVDLDDVKLNTLLYYRTLVMRHTPVGARPPSSYKLVWSGRYYEVWQRPPLDRSPQIVDHVPLGSAFEPVAKPRCQDVLNLARSAKGAELVASRRKSPSVVSLGRIPHSASWVPDAGDDSVLTPHKPGSIELKLQARTPQEYDFWLAGSFQPRVTLRLDGALIGDGREELNYQGEFHHFGRALISTGKHQLGLTYGGTDLHPGSAARGFQLGPLVLTRGSNTGTLESVPPDKARSLCGEKLDWIEVVRS